MFYSLGAHEVEGVDFSKNNLADAMVREDGIS